MRRSIKVSAAALLPLLLILMLGLAACGQTSEGVNANTPANEVDMSMASFVQTDVTISKGEAIHFVDQQSGTTHILCIGKNGHCDPSATGPQGITGQGFTIQPGQSRDVSFDAAGTYSVTCPIHPNMILAITVR